MARALADSIVDAGTAADYQALRVDSLTSAWEQSAEHVSERPGRKVGDLACRGRMCALPVTFGSEEGLSDVIEAARHSADRVGEETGIMPLVHFMTLPTDPDGTTRGHFFFEWLPESQGQH